MYEDSNFTYFLKLLQSFDYSLLEFIYAIVAMPELDIEKLLG